MLKKKFDKEEFRRSIIYTLKSQFRKTLADATPQEMYQAVAYAVKDIIVDALGALIMSVVGYIMLKRGKWKNKAVKTQEEE